MQTHQTACVMTYMRGKFWFSSHLGPAHGLHFGEVGVPHHPPRIAIRCRAAVARQRRRAGTACSTVPLGQSAAEAVLFCSSPHSSIQAKPCSSWMHLAAHMPPSTLAALPLAKLKQQFRTCCCTSCGHVLRVGPMQRQCLEGPRRC